MANPSGRLCTKRTEKTNTEVLTSAPRSLPTCTSRSRRPRRATMRKSSPVKSPATTLPPDPSSRAGSSRPMTDATDMTPAASPQSAGSQRDARPPMKKTGMAPRPVASVVPVAARRSSIIRPVAYSIRIAKCGCFESPRVSASTNRGSGVRLRSPCAWFGDRSRSCPESRHGSGGRVMATPDGNRVVIAGGGVAGLEALLALHDLAGDRAELTLVSPQPDFLYKPLLVEEPFGLGPAEWHELAPVTEEMGAGFVPQSVRAVDADSHLVEFGDGSKLEYDQLVVCAGGTYKPAFDQATTFPSGGPEPYRAD